MGAGIESISMRGLAQELGVEAMSRYTHVRNKDDLLDGMVDAVISKIPTSANGADWKTSLRQMVLRARSILLSHPWAPCLIESRTTPGPATMRYINTVIGLLREGGFTIAQAHHALHILGRRALGFTHELFDDSEDLEPEAAASLASELRAALPYVAEMALAVTHEGALGRWKLIARFTPATSYRTAAPALPAHRDSKDVHAHAKAKSIPISFALNHGCSLSLYFHNPEGNLLEIIWATGIKSHEPIAEAIQPDELERPETELLDLIAAPA